MRSVAALALLCGLGCAAGAGELETIPRAPDYVLTVPDLAARVRRSGAELAVQTGGVLVVGVVARVGTPCDLAARAGCDGAAQTYELAPIDGGRARVWAVLGDARGVELGETYVVSGTVEPSPSAPERWILRGQVMARVAR